MATYLATINISHTTIKVYLAGVRHMHVSAGLFSFFDKQLTPRLQLTLKGIQKNQAVTQSPRIRLPITLQLMGNIKALLAKQPSSYSNIMIWAACCLAFFGFCVSVNLQFQQMTSMMSLATYLLAAYPSTVG